MEAMPIKVPQMDYCIYREKEDHHVSLGSFWGLFQCFGIHVPQGIHVKLAQNWLL
jgi:hypothetical protein